MWNHGEKFSIAVIALQVIYIVIFAFVVEYGDDAKPRAFPKELGQLMENHDPRKNKLESYYPMFQDVNVMIFVGFGFLMTFLKKYSYSALALNFLYAVVSVQWALIIQGLWESEGKRVKIDVKNMIAAEFGTATVLITYGALLGKTSPLQMVLLSVIEITIFACNEHLLLSIYKIADIGGSISLHTFGAYFGLAASFLLHRKSHHNNENEGASYQSDIFAMIGTIYLWLFWPSFNSALDLGNNRHRAVINTYLSLCCSCVWAFAVSALMDKKRRFNMVHIQNATVAGGVAIGTVADLMTRPYGAMIIGSMAGIISVVGYHKLTPFLAEKFNIHDTCGVNNLHGMPGVFSGLVSSVMASIATQDVYQTSLYEIYSARAPSQNTTESYNVTEYLSDIEPGDNRSATSQALYQLLGLVTTIAIAVGGGLVTGVLIRLPHFDPPDDDLLFDDAANWELPEDDSIKVFPASTTPTPRSREVKKSEETSKF